MTAPTIVLTDAPEPEDRTPIASGVIAFNDPKFGPANFRALAVLLKDEAGATVGGLWGRTVYNWLYVELLFVPETFRGQGLGRELLARAEAEAHARGAVGAWIDCFGDANRGFYERAGYEAFGSIPGQPPGSERFFLKKALAK